LYPPTFENPILHPPTFENPPQFGTENSFTIQALTLNIPQITAKNYKDNWGGGGKQGGGATPLKKSGAKQPLKPVGAIFV